MKLDLGLLGDSLAEREGLPHIQPPWLDFPPAILHRGAHAADRGSRSFSLSVSPTTPFVSNLDRLPALAAELVRIPVNVIVACGLTIRAAREATATVPIVMAAD
jgi:hypothetical protein